MQYRRNNIGIDSIKTLSKAKWINKLKSIDLGNFKIIQKAQLICLWIKSIGYLSVI